MKRILCLLLILILALPLAACATQENKPSQTEQTGASVPSETAAPSTQDPPASPSGDETPTAVSVTPTPETPTPETPTPTPSPETPTLSAEELLEKKKNNTAMKTEKDLDVIPVGTYEFILPDGRKIALDDGGNMTIVDGKSEKGTSFLVSFQNSGKDKGGRKAVRYVIYAGDSVKKSLKDSNFRVSFAAQDDHSMSTNWYIEEHEDGTVSLRCVSGRRYLVVDKNNNLKSNYAAMDGETKDFRMKLVKAGSTVFHQSISEKGNIILRISNDIKSDSKLSYERQAKLVNDLQTAYETYWDLTDYQVWESIVCRVYEKENYFGYIIPDWNVISFNIYDAIDDLKKMAIRWRSGINDWNFCLLHEMGHMFDAGRGWKFDGEFATDLKVAYVLYANSDVDAQAATAGYSARVCFNGASFKDMWVGGNTPMVHEFNFDRQLCLFVSYCETIGWENVRKAYHEIQHMATQETDPVKMYVLFTNTMQKYAPNGEHIEDFMKPGELDVLLANLRK